MVVHHVVPPEDWPTAEEAARSLWFTPVRLGSHCTAQTRTWVPAMVPWRATEQGYVTDDVIDWYVRFAQGRPGVIVVEATGIRDVPSGPLLRIGDDRFVEGLSRLVEHVRRASAGETKLIIQLIDFLAVRRRPDPAKYFERFLTVTHEHRRRLAALCGEMDIAATSDTDVRRALAALSDADLDAVLTSRELEALRCGARERVTDVDLPHVRDLPRMLPNCFGAAARRAERAGFDGVELHFAHAYTMASFLSALNTRNDGYGGPREQRVRLPLEVYRAVREHVGRECVVGCRFLGDEAIAGGNTVEEATYFAVEFARAGMDYLSLSKGGKFEDAKQPHIGEAAYPYTGPSGLECMPTVRSDARGPFGRNLHLARDVRSAVRASGYDTPVVASGGINSFRLAEGALQRGDADIIAAARQSLADPDWYLKMRAGRGNETRRCKLTNYCEGLDQKHKQVTCQLWDKIRAEDADTATTSRTADGKRRLLAPVWNPRESE